MIKKLKLPLQKRLREVLDYDLETGIFRWRVSPHTTRVGAIAGRNNGHNRVRICIDRRSFLASRLAWVYVYGDNSISPESEIDHLNKNTLDDSISNLRLTDRYGNMKGVKNSGQFIKGLNYHM